MKTKKKNLNSLGRPPVNCSEGSESSARLPWDYSRPTLAVGGVEKYQLIHSVDVNLTIQLKVKEFTRKQATLLAGQALYQVAHEGLTLGDWMVIEFLYSYLLGQKLEPFKVKNLKELELLLLLKVVLLSGTFIGLVEKVQLPEDILLLLENSKWVPNKRTWFSRKDLFRLDKFLYVRIVPVDDLIERSKDTIRYSSYCKGYGESSHMGRRQKTRPSYELDGEPVDLEKEVEIPLSSIDTFLQLALIEIKYSLRSK